MIRNDRELEAGFDTSTRTRFFIVAASLFAMVFSPTANARQGQYKRIHQRAANQHVHGTMKAALFSYNKKQSFGLVAFDTTAADPAVTYQVVTIDGDTVHGLEIKRSQLK